MHDIIDQVFHFNQEAGLLGGELDTFAETAYILEEAMEGFEGAFNGAHEDGTLIVPGDKEWITARQWSLSFMNQILQAFEQRGLPLPNEVAEFDKSIDGSWFNIGRLAKMGLSREQVKDGFDAVYMANIAKIGGPKDEHGKQLKPVGWTGPEDELQKILDKRVSNV